MGTAFPKKQIGGDKGKIILVVRERVVTLIFSHVLGVVVDLCFLGNAFGQWGKSVTSAKEGKFVSS